MEMSMMMMKNEEQPKRERLFMADCELSEERHVKRRRRDTAASLIGNTEQIGQENGIMPATTAVKRSSKYRGVSKHRWTGRYEAHLWDKLSWNVTQKKKGKQGS